MHRVTTVAKLREMLFEERRMGKRVAFVPTMGALHAGHLSLVKIARQNADRVVVSIFVNPTQFNNRSDLEKYPRTIAADAAQLENIGVFALFAPDSPEQIYASDFQSWINNEKLSVSLEGASRPGHFRGMATVVTILFNIVAPDLAIFGEKDFQQLRIVEKLVEDLKLPIKIIRGPISREEGGLARSSRNERLTERGRETAKSLSRALFIIRDAFRGGERRGPFLAQLGRDALLTEPAVQLDYIEVVREADLEPVRVSIDQPSRCLLAATVEGVRLIDNIELNP